MPRKSIGSTTVPMVVAARDLRQNMTQSEKKLWRILRSGNCGGLKFRRQHPIASYVLDFFCTEKMLAVELDGEIHMKAEQAEADAERTRKLNEMGIRVIRIRNDELKNIGAVLERIIQFSDNP